MKGEDDWGQFRCGLLLSDHHRDQGLAAQTNPHWASTKGDRTQGMDLGSLGSTAKRWVVRSEIPKPPLGVSVSAYSLSWLRTSRMLVNSLCAGSLGEASFVGESASAGPQRANTESFGGVEASSLECPPLFGCVCVSSLRNPRGQCGLVWAGEVG